MIKCICSNVIKEKQYQNKEWLKEQILLGKTQSQIAEECNVSSTTISVWFNGKTFCKVYRSIINVDKKKGIPEKIS